MEAMCIRDSWKFKVYPTSPSQAQYYYHVSTTPCTLFSAEDRLQAETSQEEANHWTGASASVRC